ncbi:hypothetical protein K8Q98_02500 [Candidatus Nomurabacteria bacterium]|nr:hypothetical protein [Candidatus Nomurabacteria bacterium]
MTWAFKRQLIYFGILVIFLVVFGYLISYPYLHKAPTCFDSKQNGDEEGIDCGGSCFRECLSKVDEVSVLWARSFKVIPGRYNALAYLENQNSNTAVNKIHYRFRFADKDNVYIGTREGEAFIPPSRKFAIFEPAIDVGNSIPVHTSFTFTEVPLWLQVSEDKVNELKVFAGDITLEDENTSPRLSATVKNDSFFIIPDMNVVAILYDASGNALAVSQTYIEVMQAGESKEVHFTWPEPIMGQVVFKEIIPLYNIFWVKLK